VVLLEELQPGALGLEPASGDLLGVRVVEGAVLVRLNKLGDEFGAGDRELAEFEFVLTIEGLEPLRVGRGELHDLVDDFDLGGVQVGAEELEIVVDVVVAFGRPGG